MKARLTQLLARYIAVGLTTVAAWLGAEGVETGDLAAAIALVVASLFGFITDLLIHRKKNGGVMKTPPAAIGLVLLIVLAGCSTTPAEQWAAARASVTTAQDVTVALHETEVIDDEDVLQIGPWLVSARGLVNAAYPFIDEGGPEFESKLDEARDLLADVRRELKENQ